MRLRSFTEQGIEDAAEVLSAIRLDQDGEVEPLLQDNDRTVNLGVRFTLPSVADVDSRFKLGLWLNQTLDDPNLERSTLLQPGLWTWLSLAMIDIIAPREGGARNLLADDARYVFRRGDFRKSYRHLLAGPFFMVKAHLNNVAVLRAVLSAPPHSPGELYEQLSSRRPIFMSSAALEVAARLYMDDKGTALRRGASSAGAGGARRLADVLMQLDVTHDLIACDTDYLIQLLPREFDRWQGRQADLGRT